ncbi:uncharacterized protein LOC110450733 isoform X3 [Mizuhopecten yessoensis]|uniref:uncharacterized protein LOC110450733 isoform X3 n=1 Tax=Mizuhopecten yessoensis TaxID=6573 RepID=UPI000B45EE51|nr:uncharacterized protein LOC110450733 isoform X3 [Mizuhopecten yessoensis]
MASDIPKEAIVIHNSMVHYLSGHIGKTKLKELTRLFRLNPLTTVEIDSVEDIYDLFEILMRYIEIAIGDYTQFVLQLHRTNPDLAIYVTDKEKEIKSIVDGGPSPGKKPRPGDQGQQQSTDPTAMTVTTADTSQAKNPTAMTVTTADTSQAKSPSPGKKPRPGDQGQQQSTDPTAMTVTTADTSQAKSPSPAKQPRPGDQGQQQSTDPTAMTVTTADTSQAKKIHPDLEPMIETAKARIKKEKIVNKFYPTKGFRDAKEKLLNNRVVVIKGNTGDGKTAIAVQLLHWLSEEQQAGQPLQLHEIKKLDLLAPNLKLITFIDDIFGEKDASKKDVQQWNKRISDVKTLFLDKKNQTNFLIITIRNKVFNSLEKRSLGTIFNTDNIIDLSSHTYELAVEKQQLLVLYEPENFSWTDTEKSQILTYAPNIGFPQCCQLFYNSEELQKERVRFFENPFYFLNEALSILKEWSALLYLFLNDGVIRVEDLDPNSKKVNETLLEQAFSIKLIDGKYHTATYHTATLFCDKIGKVGVIKDSFDKLLGFLVKKEKNWSGEDVYRFNHDSIYAAVAILYGNVTPIGYIQNCPSKSLSYLTTSETATKMIVISSDHFTEMCERLLQEFESEEKRCGTSSIGSLDVWNDHVFVKRFVSLLNHKNVDKLAVLNKACSFGAEEFVLYLLSKGVRPDKDTALSLVSGHLNDSNRQVRLLREIVVYLNDETKVDVLNQACSFGAEEFVLYFLSEGVRPDKDTALSLVSGHWNDSNRQVFLLRKIVVYLDDETKVDVLNTACVLGVAECVKYLLSEGVKPDKDTAWWSLIEGHCNDRNGHVGLLRKIVVYLDEETKVNVLSTACFWGAEECVLYLLSEGVKPDKDTAWWSLFDGHCDDRNRQLGLLRKIVVYLDDETKVAVLNTACFLGAEVLVLYLLSEGVKPDNDTALWSLIDGHCNDRNRQMGLLRKIVVYLDDETKVAVLKKAFFCGAEECAL